MGCECDPKSTFFEPRQNSLIISLPENLEDEELEAKGDILGHELWTDVGSRVGVIDDYLINPLNGEIIAYLFDTSGRLGTLGGQFQLPPNGIINIDSKRVTASIAAVRDAEEW